MSSRDALQAFFLVVVKVNDDLLTRQVFTHEDNPGIITNS